MSYAVGDVVVVERGSRLSRYRPADQQAVVTKVGRKWGTCVEVTSAAAGNDHPHWEFSLETGYGKPRGEWSAGYRVWHPEDLAAERERAELRQKVRKAFDTWPMVDQLTIDQLRRLLAILEEGTDGQ